MLKLMFFLSRPNSKQTWEELIEQLEVDWKDLGAYFLWEWKQNGVTQEVYRLDPCRVFVQQNEKGDREYRYYERDEEYMILKGDDILFSKMIVEKLESDMPTIVE